MGDIELAVKWSKRFESVLERRHGAQGRGLHEKLDSIGGKLPERTVRDLRLIATVRNKIVHDDGYNRIDRRAEFKAACKRANRELSTPLEIWKPRLLIASAAIAFIGIALLLHALGVYKLL